MHGLDGRQRNAGVVGERTAIAGNDFDRQGRAVLVDNRKIEKCVRGGVQNPPELLTVRGDLQVSEIRLGRVPQRDRRAIEADGVDSGSADTQQFVGRIDRRGWLNPCGRLRGA